MVKELLAALPKRSLNHSISRLETDGENLSNAEDIVNTSTNYFSTIGEKLAKNIQKHDIHSYTHFLKNRIFSSFFVSQSSIAEFYTEQCSPKLKKSTSPDDNPFYFVKLVAPFISPYLTCFIETSFKLGIFSNSLRVARVISIFKKGSNTAPKNFRPIFILPALSKIFEKVLTIKLFKFFTQSSVLQCTQIAFVKNIIELKPLLLLLHTYTTTYIQTIILVS